MMGVARVVNIMHRQIMFTGMLFVNCTEFGLIEFLWSSFVDLDTCQGVDCLRAFLFMGFGAVVLPPCPSWLIDCCTEIKKNPDATLLHMKSSKTMLTSLAE